MDIVQLRQLLEDHLLGAPWVASAAGGNNARHRHRGSGDEELPYRKGKGSVAKAR
jgi:hypothetical protein